MFPEGSSECAPSSFGHDIPQYEAIPVDEEAPRVFVAIKVQRNRNIFSRSMPE